MDMHIDHFLQSLSTHIDLGHTKRNQAFLRQVESYCRNSFGHINPQAENAFAEVMSSYRFCRNEQIPISQIRKSRLEYLVHSWSANDTMLLINDVSTLDYYRHESKLDRRAVGDGRGRGYEYVCNLAVSLEQECVMGVAHDCLIDKDGPDDCDIIDYHADMPFMHFSAEEQLRLACNHKHQILCHFRHVNRLLPGIRKISVADREFDDHYFFQECLAEGGGFVIRSNALRNVQIPLYDWLPEGVHAKHYQGLACTEGYTCVAMQELIKQIPLHTYKAIALDGKGRHTDADSAVSWANLAAGACTIRLYRDFKRNKQYIRPTEYVNLNVVVVKEIKPPSGREPICWVLLTSLPVATWEEIRKVVRIYELRWLIECFFKLLKSGYKIEDLRVDSGLKIAKHIVCITLAAVFILNLKTAAELPLAARMDQKTYTTIKNAGRNLNDETIPINLRIFAYIASTGGWLGRKNDPISTLTLMKGFKLLMQNLETMENARPFLNQVATLFGKTNAYDR